MAACEGLEQTEDEGSVYDVFCTQCANDNKQSEAETYCVECLDYFCVRCLKDHNRFAIMKTHQINLIAEINTNAEESILNGRATANFTKKETSHLSATVISDFNVRTSTDKNVCAIEGCCLLDEGTLVITDAGNIKLKTVNSLFKVTDSCKMVCSPLGVCATDTREVAVALYDYNTVQFVHVSKKLQCTSSFKTDGKCCGLAYANSVLFVSYACHKKDEIHTYRKDGTPLQKWSVNTKCFDRTSMYISSCITIDTDHSNIFYSNCNNGVITMDTNGQNMTSFTDKDMKNAAGICVLENGDILVCEYDANQIFQFTADGRKLGSVLQQQGGLRKPQAICVDQDNSRIIIAMDIADTMKVFKWD